MNFSDGELRYLLYCCSAELRARRAGKPPGVQRPLVDLVRRLELELAVSDVRQEQDGGVSGSEYEAIGSQEAADILGWTTRQVQRRAADLDGRKTNPRCWVFPKRSVLDYREAMSDGRNIA